MKKNLFITWIIIAILTSTSLSVAANGDWFENLGEKLNDNETLSPPSYEKLELSNHNQLVYSFTNKNGMNKSEANQMALEIQLEKAAIFNEAKSRGLSVSKSEAQQAAMTERELLLNGKSANSEEMKAKVNSFIEGLGISEAEYWEDYVVEAKKNVLLEQKLLEHEFNRIELSKDNFKKIQKFLDEITVSYINEQKQSIGNFVKDIDQIKDVQESINKITEKK
ncbi:hypothetical protein [Salisediminibacterium selenitireducens]|uniref:DUF5667 domain-containing protein n=1 Tax=Bacillus selenitireducens (strain ATCC 700615 / DSM 15326 / MLS10) TaxID=439292 RepID=D6XZW4_BACIE|nr:hypothetical protein [Salisediminibacterium selenitireducens]ADI00466.1 hypothetical protein Bsel_2983 [[Bacillus] selenitireducens MLS10]